MSTQVKVEHADLAGVTQFLIETLRSYAEGAGAEWTSETPIEAVGIDSFDFVEIIFKLEDKYGIELDYNANLTFSELQTIGTLALQIWTVVDHKMAA